MKCMEYATAYENKRDELTMDKEHEKICKRLIKIAKYCRRSLRSLFKKRGGRG